MSADLQAFPAGSLVAEQRACDRWRQEFNHVRPHEALGGKTPSELYKRSDRRPVRTRFLYPSGWLVRTVTDQGVAHVDGAQIQAGRALVRQRVAFEPLGGLKHRLWFCALDLGVVDLPMPNVVIDELVREHLGGRVEIQSKRRTKRAA